jgi:ATP-dependent Clp protease ATP-binding subunit ClpA
MRRLFKGVQKQTASAVRQILDARRGWDVMATATQTASGKELDTQKRSSTASRFEKALRKKVVGQEEAVQSLVDLYQVFCAGLQSPGRPVGKLGIIFHDYKN